MVCVYSRQLSVTYLLLKGFATPIKQCSFMLSVLVYKSDVQLQKYINVMKHWNTNKSTVISQCLIALFARFTFLTLSLFQPLCILLLCSPYRKVPKREILQCSTCSIKGKKVPIILSIVPMFYLPNFKISHFFTILDLGRGLPSFERAGKRSI